MNFGSDYFFSVKRYVTTTINIIIFLLLSLLL